MNKETVHCKWCGGQTPMLETEMCNRCWELDTRISCDLDLAERMIEQFKIQRINRLIINIMQDAEETQKLGYEDCGDEFTDFDILTEKLINALKEVI